MACPKMEGFMKTSFDFVIVVGGTAELVLVARHFEKRALALRSLKQVSRVWGIPK
jgi:hypothetical protein